MTRDDLVGQYIGHTAPKTKEVLKKAMGGVLFIDEAYYLYRPENERDYGQEAIEILLQVMENQRDDLVVILAGYKDRMDTFFQSNPGLSSRIAHHLDFPDYSHDELLAIADRMLDGMNYRFDDEHETPSASTWRAGSRSRTSPTRAACATRSTACGCARPAGCSPTATRELTRDDLTHAAGRGHPRQPRLRQQHLIFDPRKTAMPLSQRWTLTRYLIEQRRRFPEASGELNALILDVAMACKAIARIVAFGELGDGLAAAPKLVAGAVNVQGEVQKPLDVLSNDIFIRMNEWSGHLAGMASEEMAEP